MHYGDPIIRKAVPLAIGLVSASNPQLPILDTLSKYSHDNDLQVAINAIFAMGLVGAGTNNARLACCSWCWYHPINVYILFICAPCIY